MKNLFLIDGLAGTGKSDCIEYIYDKCENLNACVIKKYTTRPQRTRESAGELKSDLIFVTQAEFALKKQELGDDFVSYYYGKRDKKYEYGFNLKEIENQLRSCNNVFIVVTDTKTIENLINRYDAIYNVIPVFIFTDTQLVLERLRRENYSEQEIADRLEKNEIIWDDYASQSIHIYKHTIINNSDKTDFHRLIKQLLDYYNKEVPGAIRFHNGTIIKLGHSIAGHSDSIKDFLKHHPYEKNIFLMIKYRKSNKVLRSAIKSWVRDKGYNCVIADENELTNDVYNPIALSYVCKYGIVVFDEPEENNTYSPNVAYELGSMQAQFKNCLIAKSKSLEGKNFFDILKDNVNTYEDEDDLEPIIKQWIDNLEDSF